VSNRDSRTAATYSNKPGRTVGRATGTACPASDDAGSKPIANCYGSEGSPVAAGRRSSGTDPVHEPTDSADRRCQVLRARSLVNAMICPMRNDLVAGRA
jgi:hypothetical protein